MCPNEEHLLHLDARIVLAIQYIGSNISRKLTVSELASHACLSYWHFCRLFRLQMGCSPAAYMRAARMDHASKLLEKTSLSIKEIASRLSVDESHFIRDFQRAYGDPPSRYRSTRIL
jgi:transcriptional regulator GlxA family with amidase domain